MGYELFKFVLISGVSQQASMNTVIANSAGTGSIHYYPTAMGYYSPHAHKEYANYEQQPPQDNKDAFIG